MSEKPQETAYITWTLIRFPQNSMLCSDHIWLHPQVKVTQLNLLYIVAEYLVDRERSARRLNEHFFIFTSMFGLVTSSTRAFRPCSTTLLPSLTRSFVNRALTKPVPPATGVLYTLGILHIQLILNRSCTETITTPNDFLKSIGRSMDTKLTSAPESWDDFWRTSGLDMRKVGLSVRDRR